MSIIDIVILLVIVSGAVIGFKRGFTSQLVSSLGFFLVVIFSFLLKNIVSIFLYENLPFFGFGGVLKGVTVLNIALYEVIAFFVVMAVLIVILRILLAVTKIFEKALDFTIVLGIPSKIAGAVVGVIESYIWIFIILYVSTLPIFGLDLNDSKYKNNILNKTPFLSGFIDNSLDVINEFALLKDKYEETPNGSEFNKETLELFLKYDVITVESVEKLVDKDKLKIDNINTILDKYKEE